MHASKRMIAGLAVVAVLLVAGGVGAVLSGTFTSNYNVVERSVSLEFVPVDTTGVLYPEMADCPNLNPSVFSETVKGTQYDFGIKLTSIVNVSSVTVSVVVGPKDNGWISFSYRIAGNDTNWMTVINGQENSYRIDLPNVSVTVGEERLFYCWITHHGVGPTNMGIWATVNLI